MKVARRTNESTQKLSIFDLPYLEAAIRNNRCFSLRLRIKNIRPTACILELCALIAVKCCGFSGFCICVSL